MVLPEGDGRPFGTLMDLQMMLLFGGGRIRTEQEFLALFHAAGLDSVAVHATASPNIVVDGRLTARD
jgi:hypothetical protein